MPTKTASVKVGMQFRAPYADSNALWSVIEKRGRGTWLCEIVNEPVKINGKMYDSDYSGTQKAFLTAEIARAVGLNNLFKKMSNEQEDYYASLKPGQIVHYHNGHANFVRCVVVKQDGQNVLKPIALVGNWQKHDLPHRDRSGEIYEPFYVKKISQGEPFTPNYTNVFESPTFGQKVADPSKLKPISLEVPPMTESESAKANAWKKVDEVQCLRGENPFEILEKMKEILNG